MFAYVLRRSTSMWLGTRAAAVGVLTAMLLATMTGVAPPARATEIRPAINQSEPQTARVAFELPFPSTAKWIVVGPADDRSPGQHDAWAVNFRPADPDQDLVTAPADGRVRVLDLRPVVLPSWCPSTAYWTGPQVEIQIDRLDGSTISLGFLDGLAVRTGDWINIGQVIGRLSASGCGGDSVLQLIRWERREGRVSSQPFGALSAYRDEDLVPGLVVIRGNPASAVDHQSLAIRR